MTGLLTIQLKKEYSFSDVVERLVDLSYTRQNMVLSMGHFSVRGDIIDIYDQLLHRNHF